MKKLLQIVIPTYNRTAQLQETMKSISTLYHSRAGSRFCVDVFDNSDKITQKINESIIPKFVTYHKNLSNLGYAGNVKRCLNSNDGKYIWLISDDDILNICIILLTPPKSEQLCVFFIEIVDALSVYRISLSDRIRRMCFCNFLLYFVYDTKAFEKLRL